MPSGIRILREAQQRQIDHAGAPSAWSTEPGHAEGRVLIAPKGCDRASQPRETQAVGLPAVQDRFHQIRRQQRQPQEAAEVATCPASSPLRQKGGVEERKISGSS
ncbi:hypothetical protein [Humitalea rosea]|uniref:hypothetical protein n=1 Tax=Humitalea rosea TaxID=990373 RepID=UPI0011B3A132|nr:hypothetical protein [Humitalea rosea]